MINAYDLAGAYNQAVSAYWRGESDTALSRLTAWLGEFWTDTPAEFSGRPITVTPHAGGGGGIRWHEIGESIVGCVPGRRGCYRIPRNTDLPTGDGITRREIATEPARFYGVSAIARDSGHLERVAVGR